MSLTAGFSLSVSDARSILTTWGSCLCYSGPTETSSSWYYSSY